MQELRKITAYNKRFGLYKMIHKYHIVQSRFQKSVIIISKYSCKKFASTQAKVEEILLCLSATIRREYVLPTKYSGNNITVYYLPTRVQSIYALKNNSLMIYFYQNTGKTFSKNKYSELWNLKVCLHGCY